MLIAIAPALACGASATNSSLSEETLLRIGFAPALNMAISPNLVFQDETGRGVRLGDYFGKKPTVLIMGYFGCPMLCSLVLNGAIESFRNLKWRAGEDFNVIDVSIDPTETRELGAVKKANYLRSYGPGAAGGGWHFLTGDNAAIQKLADEVGFRFAYDPALKEYAHPSGFIVLTPDGRISRYFCGVTFSATEVDRALRDAAAQTVGTSGNEFSLTCFHYSPPVGRYGKLVLYLARGSAAVAVILLGLVVSGPFRRRKLRAGA